MVYNCSKYTAAGLERVGESCRCRIYVVQQQKEGHEKKRVKNVGSSDPFIKKVCLSLLYFNFFG